MTAAVLAGAAYFYSSLSDSSRGGNATPRQTAATSARGGGKQGLNVPPDEQNFVGIISQYAASYTAVPDESEKDAFRAQRAQAICALLQNRIGVSDWVGTISTSASNAEGKGVLGVSLSSKPTGGQASVGQVTVGTWNNDLSDVSDDTLIPPGSPILKRVAAMSVGTLVRFSGNFFPSQTDCVEEQSVTTVASMLSPEFTFRFSDVEPYLSAPAEVSTPAGPPPHVPVPAPAPPSVVSTTTRTMTPPGTPSGTQPAPPQPSTPPLQPPEDAAFEDAAFEDGHSDRVKWEDWLASLHGAERQGALYWAQQRSSRHPRSCEHGGRAAFRNDTSDEILFAQGCQEAEIRLVTSDARRKSEPLYSAGWDAPVATRRQAPATKGQGTPPSQ